MKRRHAFTLVELMVSMALIIFIMAILSQAFIAALGVFRDLKGQGDLAEKLRSTAQILQHDLAANHFDGNRRLSDLTFWNNGPPRQGFFQVYHGSASVPMPVPQVIPPVPASYIEGFDLDVLLPPLGIPSYLTTNHAMAFTVKLVGNDMGDFMSASPQGSGCLWLPPLTPTNPAVPQLPNGIGSVTTFGPAESRYQLSSGNLFTYNYQWGEVAWFLQPQINPSTGQPDYTAPDPNSGTAGVPLYTLFRRQRLLVPDNNLVTQFANIAALPSVPRPIVGIPNGTYANYLETSCWQNPPGSPTGNLYFNNPTDVTVPLRRLGGGSPASFTTIAQDLANPIYANPTTSALTGLIGADVQLNDVVSFDVRLLPLCPITPLSVPPTILPTAAPLNPADPFVTLYDPPFNTVFKTANTLTTGAHFDTWSSVSDGQAGQDYSSWITTIPYWNSTQLTYQYPVGTIQTMTTPGVGATIGNKPVIGSGPIIRAIQITLRIWDFKTNQSRQVTFVQAM